MPAVRRSIALRGEKTSGSPVSHAQRQQGVGVDPCGELTLDRFSAGLWLAGVEAEKRPSASCPAAAIGTPARRPILSDLALYRSAAGRSSASATSPERPSIERNELARRSQAAERQRHGIGDAHGAASRPIRCRSSSVRLVDVSALRGERLGWRETKSSPWSASSSALEDAPESRSGRQSRVDQTRQRPPGPLIRPSPITA